MVSDKRADIIVSLPQIKIPIEIKRDYHRDVWTALNGQLDKLYTKNPDAAGHGIYLVFGLVLLDRIPCLIWRKIHLNLKTPVQWKICLMKLCRLIKETAYQR